ncbi:hypothetical protein FRZ03_04485 [Streptomyces misionensis]|uniref:Lipoprotein n=1 Tax=Streptomyces misionensis TaxID=67331 RepID=A0A5C6K019_9ACTN|nr:hypothetical protein [Streptomyces misionensis]TWV56355.1 hypothetical protein FRZ03_04485 [Streptomyces misionensis]
MSASRKPWRAGICLVTGACALLVGCGPPDAPGPTASAVTAGPVASAQARALLLPYDRYEMTPADVLTVEAAEDALMVPCMRAQGRTWKPLPRAADADPPNRSRYGVIEPGVAERYGYHQPPPPPGVARRTAAENARNAELTQADADAAFGRATGHSSSVDGCWKTAHDRLRRHVPASDHALLDELTLRSFETSLKEPRVRGKLALWKSCMKRSGFSYATPLDAADDPAWAGTKRPARRELLIATADVRCKTSTGLVDLWKQAETAWQQDFVNRHAEAFHALARAKEVWLRAARAALR